MNQISIDKFTDAFIQAALVETAAACGAKEIPMWHADDIKDATLKTIAVCCSMFQRIAHPMIEGKEEAAGRAFHSRLVGSDGFMGAGERWERNAPFLNRLAAYLGRTRLPGCFLVANEHDQLVFQPRTLPNPLDFDFVSQH